ncbi:MAG: TonB-dependent receptor [Bacteroidota bacterium]
MKHILIALLSLLIIPTTLFGQGDNHGGRPGGPMQQGPPIGKLHGTVLDASTEKPVEFATVALYRRKDSALVTGGTTNAKGKFDIENLPFGRYKVKINFIGYKMHIIDTLTISPKNPDVTLAVVKLKSGISDLNQVEITGEKNMMQVGIDRKVFNVEKSLITQGGSATDVLKTVPAIDVDIDGNVSLRGSGNVTILIDGKPSAMLSGGSTALEQIPASSIENIEVISNPSSKYDPEGMSGIININLKKNKLQGLNGNIQLGTGTTTMNDGAFVLGKKYNGSISLNYRKKWFNVYTTYSYRNNYMPGSGISNRTSWINDTASYLNQNSFNFHENYSHMIKGGFDFYLNDRTTLGITGVYSMRPETENDSNLYKYSDYNYDITSLYSRNTIGKSEGNNYDLQANFRHSFKKPQQYLSADAYFSTGDDNETGESFQYYYNPDFTLLSIEPYKQNTTTYYKSYNTSIQADYSQPTAKGKFETGFKSQLRHTDTDFKSETWNAEDSLWYSDLLLNNRFKMDEQINATYGTLQHTIKRLGFLLGLRLEQTYRYSELLNTQDKYKTNYFSYFPSVHISYSLGKQKDSLKRKSESSQELQLSYSRRINRPNTHTLNPFTDYSDPLNQRTGNPNLEPEYINSGEVGYLKRWDKVTLTSSIFYKYTTNMITRYRYFIKNNETTETVSDTSIIMPINANSATSYGMEFIFSMQPKEWWNLSGNFSFFNNAIEGGVDAVLSNSNSSWSAKLTSNMKLPKGIDLQFMGNYRGPLATLQGIFDPGWSVDGAVKKDFFKNKLSVGLRCSDIFNTRKFRMKFENETYQQDITRRRESRVVFLTLTWKFGKPDKNAMKIRKGNGDQEFDGDMGGDF